MKPYNFSIKAKIIIQFIIIILPLLVVLGYQLTSNIKSTAGLQRVSLYEHIHNAKVEYKTFLNGVVDAVDSGTVGKNALTALANAKKFLADLHKADSARDLGEVPAQLDMLLKSVSANPTIAGVIPLRDVINKLDDKFQEMDAAYADANRQVISENIARTEREKILATTACFFTLIMTTFFIFRMIRGLTSPLKEAEDLANRIALGEIKSNCKVGYAGDLGVLMDSLCAMNNSLYQTVSQLKQVAGTVSKSSKSVSASTDLVISAAQRQQTTVSQTRADIEIMNESIRHVSERSTAAMQGAAKTQEVANTGSSNMAQSLSATEQIVVAVDLTAGKINQLTDSVQKINEFTRIIREIAEQTNLLALNAAIEAARAGEQGRGFAVVADEVRKLAERTSAGTAEIAGIVTNILTQTNDAVLSMDQVKAEVAKGAGYSQTTNDILHQIVVSAREAADQSNQNAAAATEQMSAANKAVDNTARIASITSENSEHIQQMQLAANNLTSNAHELQQLISHFKLV